MRNLVIAMIAAGLAATAATAAPDLANGKKVYGGCMMCHGVTGQGTPLAPALKSIAGRKAASVPAYAYSDALRTSGIVWTDAKLAAFLAAPQKTVKGTKMFYPGLPDAKSQADVIAYIKGFK